MGFLIKKRVWYLFFSLVLVFLFFFDFSAIAAGQTASFKLEPANLNLSTNQEGQVLVKMRNDVESANAFSAQIKFDPGLVNVTSIDISGSFASFWVDKSFDNSLGKVSLIGGVTNGTPNTGFKTNGADANFAKINFKAIKTGSGKIYLDNLSEIYSNQDNTNILISPVSLSSSTTLVQVSGLMGTPSPTPAPTLAPVLGDGLRGSYYNSKILSGNIILSRVDKTINFNWGSGGPGGGVSTNNFGVRWIGFIVPKYNQEYTISFYSDDGARIWVNNQLLLNKWSDHSAKEYGGKVNLTAGVRVPIKIEYYENKGKAVAKLYWSSLSQPKQIIPQSALFSK